MSNRERSNSVLDLRDGRRQPRLIHGRFVGVRTRMNRSEPDVAERDEKNETEDAVEKLMSEIRREPVPQRMIELAQALQAALDERESGIKPCH